MRRTWNVHLNTFLYLGEYGTPASGVACTTHNTSICSDDCIENYYLNPDNLQCEYKHCDSDSVVFGDITIQYDDILDGNTWTELCEVTNPGYEGMIF